MLYLNKNNADKFMKGKVSSFTFGGKKLEEQTNFVEIDNVQTSFNEINRLFKRLVEHTKDRSGSHSGDSVALINSTDKPIAQEHFMSNYGTFFAPMNDLFGQKFTIYVIKFSNNEVKYYGKDSIIRTVENENATPQTINVGDRLKDEPYIKIDSCEQVNDAKLICYTRPNTSWNYEHGKERIYTSSGEEPISIGLRFKIYQENSDRGYVYFDDARLETSNVLWEFSPDSGANWYCNFTLPNKPYQRLLFPHKTNQIKVRATSRSDNEWIRGYSIQPHASYKKYGKYISSGTETNPSVSLKTGKMAWEMNYPVNSPIFTVKDTNNKTKKTRRFNMGQGVDATAQTVNVDYFYPKTTL